MDPDTAVVPVADEPRVITLDRGEKTEPEQKTEVAQPEGESTEESTEADDSKPKLTDEQRKIKALEKRLYRQNGKIGALSRELELRQTPAVEGEEEKPDIERIATQRAQEIVEAKALNTKAEQFLKSAKKVEGFQEALETVRDEIPFGDNKGRPSVFLRELLECDAPEKVVKYLHDNPEELEEFAELRPEQLGRRLERLETKLKQPAKTKSNAPPPIQPLGGGNAKHVDLQSAAMDDYIAQRRKQGAKYF